MSTPSIKIPQALCTRSMDAKILVAEVDLPLLILPTRPIRSHILRWEETFFFNTGRSSGVLDHQIFNTDQRV